MHDDDDSAIIESYPRCLLSFLPFSDSGRLPGITVPVPERSNAGVGEM